MMKYKKYVLGVFILITLIGICVYSATDVWANGSAPKKKDCSDTSKLINYYDIDVSSDGSTATIRSDHGVFKIKEIAYGSEKYLSNTLTVGTDGYYLVDGKEFTVTSSGSPALTINTSATDDDSKIYLALELAKDDSDTGCKAGQFITKYVDPSDGDIEYTEIGTMSQSKLSYINEQVKQPNEVKAHVKECATLASATGDELAYYKANVPNCFDDEVYNLATNNETNRETVSSLAKIAMSSWKVEKSNFNYDFTTDEQGWGFNFETAKLKAKGDVTEESRGERWFYAEKNGSGSAKLWPLKASKKDGRDVYSKASTKEVDNNFSLSCKTKANSATDWSNLEMLLYDVNGISKYNINANSDYFYGVNQEMRYVQYEWKHTKGSGKKDDVVEDKKLVCVKTCEEAVEVKYGPPVASKAGLCFEYEIKVTSRVKCESEAHPENKPVEPKICNPVPICNKIPGYTHQAGANEDFDSCIKSCDGGKYTEKCSNKCYEKVYGSDDEANKMALNKETAQVEKLAQKVVKTFSYKGHFEWSGNSIVWPFNTYSRWYKAKQPQRTWCDHGTKNCKTSECSGKCNAKKTYYPVDGFKKRYFGSSKGFCKDPCHFVGCSKNQYLNQEEIDADLNKNIKKYEDELAKCESEATCRTSTATVKISVGYNNDEHSDILKPVNISFPFSKVGDDSSQDISTGNSVCNNSDLANGKNVFLNNSNGHGIRGCYLNCGYKNENTDASLSTKYNLWWHIPGSWINAKYGDVSYKNPGEGWAEKVSSFCIPLDAKNVNTDWWNYYYEHYVETHKDDNLSINEIKDNDGDKCKVTKGDSSKVDSWNINGSVVNFGYFGWDIAVKCFYALNTNYTKEECEPPETPGGDPNATPYTIRSVDLNNPFPDTKGATLDSKTATDYGRDVVGFNWSEYANNVKNPSYVSTPKEYGLAMQKAGYSIYNDKSAEYQFVLTRNDIGALKGMTDKNYTKFNGKMITSHGIETYMSDLFRDEAGSPKITAKKLPSTSLLGCNNIVVDGDSLKCSNDE